MERDDVLRESIEAVPDVVTAAHERCESSRGGKSSHLDDVIDHCTRRIGDRKYAEIHVGSEPAIEFDLAMAVRLAQRGG